VRTLCFALLSLAAGAVLGAEVYKSVDENGVVTFSDRPDGAANEMIVVDARAPAAPLVSAAQAGTQGEPGIVEGGEADSGPTAEELEEERRQNCAIATERYDRYQISRRLYRALPDGEREYLNDEQTAAARADAEADVRNWCS